MRVHAWVLAALLPSSMAIAEPAAPWRLDRALDAPTWLTLGIEQNSRFEHLTHEFRTNPMIDDASALSLRTLVAGEAHARWFVGGIELQDSRTYASDGALLNTTLVNPLELLQAYVGVRTDGALVPKDHLDVRAGRMTIDLSTRRVVARNRFRNTINAFTGVDATWTSPDKHVARAFVVMPVTRLPGEPDALADNTIERDEENTDTLLWSAYYGMPALANGDQLEVYVVGLHERDGDVASRNRQLVTLGARWWRKPARGRVDYELDVFPQAGRSRATTMDADVTDLDHRALSWHAEIGVSPAIPWKPRFALFDDYATGDRDRDDDSTERFDPLFGARRFDFGPTGLYGAIARSNIHSPGLRITTAPTSRLDAMASYRLVWLASATDAWTTAGVRDASGDSGRFVGEQAELQVRYFLVPRNVLLDVGGVYLRRGELAKTAPNGRLANPSFVYMQLTFAL